VESVASDDRFCSRSVRRFPYGTLRFGIMTDYFRVGKGQQRWGRGSKSEKTLLTGRGMAARDEQKHQHHLIRWLLERDTRPTACLGPHVTISSSVWPCSWLKISVWRGVWLSCQICIHMHYTSLHPFRMIWGQRDNTAAQGFGVMIPHCRVWLAEVNR
jgi:hypothetical protein